MDTRFLRSLIAVVDTGSIAAAARREHVTAAALSQRLQVLERHFGTALLIRSAHAIRPTSACLALLPRARTLVRDAQALMDGLDGSDLSGELHLGAISTVLTGRLPDIMENIAVHASRLTFHVVPGTSLHLYEQVNAGQLDAAILVKPPFRVPKSIRVLHLYSEPLVFLSAMPVPPEEVQLRLARQPYLRYDPTSWGGRIAESYLEDRSLQPDVRCDLDALEAIAMLVRRGIGNALVPAWLGLDLYGVHVASLLDATAYQRDIVMIHPADATRRAALELMASRFVTPTSSFQDPELHRHRPKATSAL